MSRIYRRGHIFWWHRSVPCAEFLSHPTIIRISLKTADQREAKTRAARLETELCRVKREVDQGLKGRLDREGRKAVYYAASRTMLERCLEAQGRSPWDEHLHALSNARHAEYFTLIAEKEVAPKAGWDLVQELLGRGYAEDEICGLMSTIMHYDGGKPPISYRQVAEFLREVGIRPSPENQKEALRSIAIGYRNGCLDANRLMGIENEQVSPVPAALAAMLDLPVVPRKPKPEGPVVETVESCPSVQVVKTEALLVPDQQSDVIDCKISELAAKAIETKIESGDWHEDRRVEVQAAVNLFIAANGDLLLSTIKQAHLAQMTVLFTMLPLRYGRVKKGSSKENPEFETIKEAVERGALYKKAWAENPQEAEKNKIPKVGLSVTTNNKHLAWINSIFQFAEGQGIVAPSAKTALLNRSDTRKKNSKRLPWTVHELKMLLSGAVWSGSEGLWKRLRPGGEVFHDGFYWGPLLVACMATRSEESAGIMLSEIFEDAPVPYFSLRPTAYRRLKNDNAERRIPIAQLLIDLGFIAYVKAMRDLGHDLLFPEFWNTSRRMKFDRVFHRNVFQPLRRHHFPDGTSMMRNGKDVDVHSIRKRCINQLLEGDFDRQLRHYIVGHEQDGETDGTYLEDPPMALLKPLVDYLAAELVPPIERRPLRLRPVEFQKYGSPRGRTPSR